MGPRGRNVGRACAVPVPYGTRTPARPPRSPIRAVSCRAMRVAPKRLRAPVGALVALACVAAACHRPARPVVSPAAPALAVGEEAYCWSAAFRTALPPDSVAVRSARAYAALGFTGARWDRLADTAWAESTPTVLTRNEGPRAYRARVVAFRRGDTTVFRPFVAAGVLPPRASNADSGAHTRARFDLCGAIGRTAGNGGTAPRAPSDDERDDGLPAWRRRP